MYHFPPPILNRKIRFALVGCGRIAQNHFAAIKQHGDHAELVGVCDINSTALAEGVNMTERWAPDKFGIRQQIYDILGSFKYQLERSCALTEQNYKSIWHEYLEKILAAVKHLILDINFISSPSADSGRVKTRQYISPLPKIATK